MINREKKTKYSLFYEKHLFSFYLKKRIFSITFIVCIILSLILVFQSTSNEFKFRDINSQFKVDAYIYWENIKAIFSLIFVFVSIIIAADAVAGEFSNRSAMIIYATESRNKILAIKLLSLITSIFILMLFYFSTFLLVIFFKTNLIVSIHIFLTGFLIIFIGLIFYAILTFMISSITRSVALSFILPFFYLIVQPFLEDLELELLAYSSYISKVLIFFENSFFHEQIIFSNVTIISLITIFGLPILILLISIYGFKQLDIRID